MIIQVKDISKSFLVGAQNVPVLKQINFTVQTGDFLIIFGPSGCGKSTLLHTILGLEEPTSGQAVVLDQDIYAATTEDDRGQFRKKHIGTIYQQPNWIKALTVIENVAFPLTLLGVKKFDTIQKAGQILQTIGMANWANYLPSELSSGQQQKVALARGLIIDPEIIVADEPTGNLDFESGQELMQMLVDLNNEGKTIVMVTHDLEYLTFAKTAIEMFDGGIEGIYTGAQKDKLVSSVKSKRGHLAKKAEPKPAEKEELHIPKLKL